jgi:hypothetical protein
LFLVRLPSQALVLRRLLPFHGRLGFFGHILSRVATFDPLIHFRRQELPKATEFVCRHALPGNPFVNGVRIDSEMRGDFVNG